MIAMNTITIPFAAWEPDKPKLGGEQSLQARGVIPAAIGYRPFPAAQPSGEPLPSRVLGALKFKDSVGLPLTIAGTEDSIYCRGPVGGDGWNAKTTEPYSAFNNGWNFSFYGPSVFAVDGVDGLLMAPILPGDIGDFAVVVDAPVGRCVSAVGDFLMVGDIPGHRNRVQWSGMDNPTFWPNPGSNEAQYAQSDFNDFPEGGNVQSIVSGMSAYEGLIFCESAIYRAQYVGPPYIFQFTDVDKNKGTIAPRSVVQAANSAFFLAEDGFYATDGANVRNIGLERVNLWWRTNASDARRHEAQAAYDPVNGVIVWAFASSSCPDGIFDRMILFHPEINRFSLIMHDLEWLYVDASRGITLEDLDVYGTLEAVPFSLDAKSLIGGVDVLACIGGDHRTYLFSGFPIDALIDTAETGGARMMVHGARALIDGTEAQATIVYRDFQKNLILEKNCSPPARLDGVSRCHISTRYARVRVAIPGGTPWVSATGVELYVEGEGGL